MAKRRTGFMIVCIAACLLALTISVKSLASATPFVASCVPQFQLPADLCSGDNDCALKAHLSDTGYRFVMNLKTGLMVVASPDGRAVQTYHLPAELTPVRDFAPFDSRSVLLPGGDRLYQVDLQNQAITSYPLHTAEAFHTELCHKNPGSIDAIYRVHSDHTVLICLAAPASNADKNMYPRGLALFDVETQSLTVIKQVSWYLEDENLPWFSIVMGQDGKIYADDNERYDPKTGSWGYVSIPSHSDIRHDSFQLSAVDGASVLYYTYFYDPNRILRLRPPGVQEWITVLGGSGTNQLIDVTPGGNLILLDYPDLSGPGDVKECTVSPMKQTSTPPPPA